MIKRALALTLSILLCLVLAGCGGGGGSDSDSPLDNALGYLPERAPFVLTLETDPKGGQVKAAKKLADRVPFADQLESSLRDGLDDEDLDYARDIEPILGNEVVVGATDTKSFIDDDENEDHFVAALQVDDSDALDKLIEKSKAKQDGQLDGAKLYKDEDGKQSLAVDGDVIVLAGTKKELQDALRQRDADARMTEDKLDDATEGLSGQSLAKVYFDVHGLLGADPETATARKVKWVGGLRTAGLTASVSDGSVDLGFHLATEGIRESDLPLAAGSQSPDVLDKAGTLGFAVRDVKQFVSFFEKTFEATDPSGFEQYDSARRQIERQLSIDLMEDVFDQVSEGLSVTVSPTGSIGVRAPLSDPEAFRRTLKKIGKPLPAIVEGVTGSPAGYSAPKTKNGYFAISSADKTFVYGVQNGAFVLADGSTRAAQLGDEQATPVDGAKGSIAMRADAKQLARALLVGTSGAGSSGMEGALIGSLPLGELTGSAQTSTSGVTGRVRLGVGD